MKVRNISVYASQPNRNTALLPKEQGKFGQEQDPIFLKKQQAKQKALKIVGDTFAMDRKLDEEQNDRRKKVKELTEQLHEMEGYIEAQIDMPEEEMTPEMKVAREEAIQEYKKQCDEIKSEIKSIVITIEASKVERLKASPMQKAQEAAEKVLETASEEVINMLMQEAKENIEEDMEEKEQQAEKLAEEKQEEEERLAKTEEKKEEAEALAEQIKNSSTNEVQKEIEDMLNKLKLLEEDLKGAAVDEIL